jgi:hypothetical protein
MDTRVNWIERNSTSRWLNGRILNAEGVQGHVSSYVLQGCQFRQGSDVEGYRGSGSVGLGARASEMV